MDQKSTMIMVVVAIVIIAGLYIFLQNHKVKNRKEINSFKKLGENSGVAFSRIDVVNNLILGIDETKGKLGFSTVKNPERDFNLVECTDLESCILNTSGGGSDIKLWIQLNFKTKVKSTNLYLFGDIKKEWPDRNFVDSRITGYKWISVLTPYLQIEQVA